MAGRNCGSVADSLVKELPQNRRMRRASAAESGFFTDNGAGLLIVPALFFIQRRNGEVAEWSKALPC